MRLAVAALFLVPVIAAMAGRGEDARLFTLRLFALLQAPFRWALEVLQRAVAWLYVNAAAIFRDGADPAPAGQGAAPRRWSGERVLGALVYAGLCALLIYSDYWALALGLAALGWMSAVAEPPASIHLLSAAAVVAVLALWGLIWTDLAGLTHLGPWGRLSPRGKRLMLIATIAITATGVGTIAAMGYWRGTQAAAPEPAEAAATPQWAIAGPPLGPSPSSPAERAVEPSAPAAPAGEVDAMPGLLSAAIAGLVAVSTVPAGWGVKESLKYLVGAALGAVAVPLAFAAHAFQLLAILVEAAFGLFEQLLALLVALGQAIRGFAGGILGGERPVAPRDPPAPGQPSTPPESGAPAAPHDPPGSGQPPAPPASGDAHPWNMFDL